MRSTDPLLQRSSAFRFGLRDGLQIRQTLLEHPADHFIGVHEQADGLEHEVVLSGHAPRHHGLIAFGLEGELRDVRGFEGLEEFEVEPDELVRPVLGERHASRAGFAIARPGEDGASAGRRTLGRGFHRRIDFREGRPRLVFLEIVHLVKDDCGRRGDGGRARDAELGGLQDNDDDQDDDENGDRDKDFCDHGGEVRCEVGFREAAAAAFQSIGERDR